MHVLFVLLAIHHHGKQEIFNADQGNQFNRIEFTQLLKENCIAISMGWRDNVFACRVDVGSINYENVYLHVYETVSATCAGIGQNLDIIFTAYLL
jgi:hypothetical protein